MVLKRDAIVTTVSQVQSEKSEYLAASLFCESAMELSNSYRSALSLGSCRIWSGLIIYLHDHCGLQDAKSTCKRQKCPKLTCALIRKETEECCPRCTGRFRLPIINQTNEIDLTKISMNFLDQNDPKARPNRRLSKAGKKKQRIRKEWGFS